MRIGHLTYTNALPFYLDLPGELVSGYPTQLNGWLRDGDLDISLISSAEYLRNRHLYTPLPYGIAADGPVLSVTVTGLHDGAKVGVTRESATSRALLEILCRQRGWQVELEPLSPHHTARLVIGDAALADPGESDLSQQWHEMTGLPMVFALFAARRGVDPAPFDAVLAQNLERNLAHLPRVIERASQLTGLSQPLFADYFSRLVYSLGDREQQGLEAFAQLLEI